jgi:hypothetical protein
MRLNEILDESNIGIFDDPATVSQHDRHQPLP